MLRISFNAAVLSVVLGAIMYSPQAFAGVVITEIMYAPDGADAEREWIEVCNTGSSTDLSGWKLFENDTNHSLNVSSGSSTISQGSCAVIADNATTFSSDYPNFSGNLFDSAFSLKNTGEALQLKDENGVVQDDVTYSDSQGAKDNGLTLHRTGSSFVEGSASPGNEEGFFVNPGTGAEDPDTTAPNLTTITQYQYEALSVEPPQDIYIRLPEKIDTIAGANVSLTVEVNDARGRSVENGRITWSFGDGTTGEGRKVVHRYTHPGEYILRARIEQGSLVDEATVIVSVTQLDVNLIVPEHGEWVEVTNNNETALNLSGWRISTSNQYFIVPENTYILGNTSVRFDTKVTKLTLLKIFKSAFLLFPDGKKAVNSSAQDNHPEEVPIVILQEISTSTDSQVPIVSSAPKTIGTRGNSIVGTTVLLEEVNTVQQEDSPSEEEEKTPTIVPTTQQAAVSEAVGDEEGSTMLLWAIGLSTLLAFGVAGVIAARRNRSLADQFTIVEEKEDEQ